MTDETPGPAADGRTPRSPWGAVYWAGVALVIAGQVACWALPLRELFFYQDDFLNFAQAQHDGHRLWWFLNQPVFGKYVPVHRALVLLHFRMWPMSWGAAVAMELALAAATALAFVRLCHALWGRSFWNLGLLTAFVFNPLWLGPLRWWASALHIVPGLLFGLLSLDGFVRYLRRPGPVRAAWTGVAFGLAIAAYEKPLLVPPLALALHLGFLFAGTLRERLRRLLRAWPVYAAFGLVATAYLVHVLGHGYDSGGRLGPPADLARAFWFAWGHSVAPSFLGLLSDGSGWGALLAGQVAAATVVGLTVWRSRDAWRAWVLFAAIFVASFGLVTLARLAEFGPRIGLTPRYLVELAAFGPLALGLATLRGRPRIAAAPGVASGRWRTAAEAAAARITRGSWATAARVAAIAGSLVFVALAVHTGRDMCRSWEGRGTRAFFDNFVADARREAQRRPGVPIPMREGVVPALVLQPWYYPATTASSVLGLFPVPLSFDSADGPRFVLGDDGHLSSSGPGGP